MGLRKFIRDYEPFYLLSAALTSISLVAYVRGSYPEAVVLAGTGLVGLLFGVHREAKRSARLELLELPEHTEEPVPTLQDELDAFDKELYGETFDDMIERSQKPKELYVETFNDMIERSQKPK